MTNTKNPSQSAPRGFAAMDPHQQRAIASAGGRAAHESGHAHEFTSEEARVAGRKGGEAVSENREHMSLIGRKGAAARNSGRYPINRGRMESGMSTGAEDVTSA